MRTRTLIGLMFCALFAVSAPAFAQTHDTSAQPVLQSEKDVTIPQGTVQEFDAANGEVKFDGVLTNKGTIIIRSSYPAQAEAFLRATRIINEGKIVSEVPTLKIFAEDVFGPGEVTASESIAIHNDGRLQINGGTFRANWFRPTTQGRLIVHAKRIDAKVELAALEVSFGVREGDVNIVKQKLDADPLYYNTGGSFTMAVAPSNGFDIYILAAGDVNVGSLDATGGANDGEVGNIVITAGLHFKNPNNSDNGPFQCGSNGCPFDIQQLSLPGGPLEGADGGPFPPSGTITITGAKGKSISLTARDIVVNGNILALKDNRPPSPHIGLLAFNSVTVNGTLKTDETTVEPNFGQVTLIAPTINVNGKITSGGGVEIESFETSESANGSVTTAAIEARTFININGGHIIFGEVGGALLPSAFPHDPGTFTIKTGKLTAHRYVKLAATGNIDAGHIEVLPNEANVPLGTHDIRIHANVGKEDAQPLKIGGGTNGAASLTLQGTTDLGEGLTQKTGVIFLTNGPSGDIVLDGAKIHVTNEHEGTPSLIAYAGTGQVTVKGNIVLDGTATAPAGQVLLVGDEIRSTGATISVKDTLSDAVEKPAKVILATSKLTLAGDLTIEANSKALTSVRVIPKGSITLDPQEHFDGLYIFVDKFPVNVMDEEVVIGGSANLTIKAKSDGAKVDITAKQLKFNNGTSDVFATGTGSQVSVNYPGSLTGEISLNFNGGGVIFDVSNPEGDAGTINVSADKVRNAADDVVVFKADSESGGLGGTIIVNFDSGKLVLDNLAGGISMSASSADSDAGVIIVNAGNAAHVEITDDAVTQPVVKATGGNAGKGGTININNIRSFNPTTALDVYELFKVDGGENLNPADFGGEISLNFVTCQQWKIGSSWPQSYWDCANPSADRVSVPNNAILADFADLRVPALKAQLGNPNTNTVRLYVFESRTAFNTFFRDQITGALAGATSRSPTNKHIYVTVFLKIGQNTRSDKQIGEASAHEIGHAIDIVSNYPSAPSLNAAYGTYIQNDFLYLDYTFVGLSDAGSVRRDPCLPDLASGVSGPFLGVNDPTTNTPFCDPNTFQIKPEYAGWTNSRIAQHVSPPAIFKLDEAREHLAYPGGWAEIHAQAYAYRNYDVLNQVSPAQSNLRTANGILENGMFVCAQAWSIAENSGTATPPSPTPSSGPSQNSRFCDQVIPGWYTPGQ